MANLTPSQTIGPFFHGGAQWLLADADTPPGWVSVAGRVLDADGKAVSDAMLEVSFAGNLGFQRAFSDDDGRFQFMMPVEHFAHVTLFARGLLKHLFTRVYLAQDAVPAAVPLERRATLVARSDADRYRWDIRLQGQGETVFFDL